jgi:hypothetical protein
MTRVLPQLIPIPKPDKIQRDFKVETDPRSNSLSLFASKHAYK